MRRCQLLCSLAVLIGCAALASCTPFDEGPDFGGGEAGASAGEGGDDGGAKNGGAVSASGSGAEG